MIEESWHDAGLRFACTQCGNCCTGGPGTVRVSDLEIATLADQFGLSDEQFRTRYTRKLRGGDVSLTEKDDLDCIFYDRRVGCTVYENRPRQCKAWPFWRSIVFSQEAWNEAADSCPGMNDGRRYESDEIQSLVHADGTSRTRK